ncbi:hypothetical protein [Methylacidiphilum caldifontis]|uniref:Uncharacterized protein n=2 Tax=Methylacidiphilum caldifontis TaxID=2795386 RepID=A0A4Y8PDI1_9BACT|nr:hypothetical protein [Methylacidiphilum caldifontis]QSR88014.1 hypothetical protein IT6_06325 [Methylacidiphilum caldifontis]TFE69552.1 hypothetical protein A7Q10_06780 [Methylacidiphilum caldifontis]
MKGKKPLLRSLRKSAVSASCKSIESSFPLVCVDNKKIRQNWETHYMDLQQKLEEVQKKLQNFLAYEKPKYIIWVESTFPKETAELKRVESAIAEIKQLIFEIEIDSLLHNRGLAISCHFLLQKRKKKKTVWSPEEKIDSSFDDVLQNEKRIDTYKNRGKKPLQENKLKATYRAIARLLHPDINNKVSAEKMERWYAAQLAYKAKDLDLLESLYYLEEKQLDNLPISLLQKRIVILSKTLQKKTKELESCLGDPAWGFSQLQIDAKYIQKIKIWVNAKIKEKKKELLVLKEKMKGWKQEARRVMAKRKGYRKIKKGGLEEK